VLSVSIRGEVCFLQSSWNNYFPGLFFALITIAGSPLRVLVKRSLMRPWSFSVVKWV
jgi:hypothetical protein